MKLLNISFDLILHILSPIVIALLVLGVIAGVIKAATQIEDRSLGFALKFFMVFLLCYLFSGTWGNSIIEFTKQIWGNLEYYRL